MDVFNESGILLIRSDDCSLVKFETYLRGRGWELHSFDDPISAVGFLLKAEKRPRYALLSVDQPLSRISGICEVLRVRYGQTVVGYSARTLMPRADMQRLGIAHCLPAPVSGSSFERFVLGLQNDNKFTPRESMNSLIHITGQAASSRLVFTERGAARKLDLRSAIPEAGEVEERGREKYALLVEAIERGLEKAKALAQGSASGKRKTVSDRLHCLIVNVRDLSGYVVCACDGFEISTESLILQVLGSEITGYLKEKGILIHFNKFFPVDLHARVDTKTWWGRKADVFRFREWSGRALNVAFFHFNRTVFEIQPVESGKYTGVKVAEVDAEYEIGFNLYLHLPVSRRYFLYTRKRRMLLETQKTRLMTKGVEAFASASTRFPNSLNSALACSF